MLHSKKNRRWLWWLLPVALILLVWLGLDLFVKYRLKGYVSEQVSNSTQGAYSLNLEKIRIFWLPGRIELKNVSFIPNDQDTLQTYYKLQVPEIRLKVRSVIPILLNRQVLLDSLALLRPVFTVIPGTDTSMEGRVRREATVSSTAIGTVINEFNIRSLLIDDGSFYLYPASEEKPFYANNIRVVAKSLDAMDMIEGDKLKAVDDVTLQIRSQQWTFPGGKQQLFFNQLYFRLKEATVILDTCRIVSRSDDGSNTVDLMMDQLKLHNQDFFSFLESAHLKADSILLKKPSLRIITHNPKNRDTTGGGRKLSQALQKLFDTATLKKVLIEQGQVSLESTTEEDVTQSLTTQRADLRIDGLDIIPTRSPMISADDIDLALENVEFFSPDSLYRLAAGKLRIQQKNLVLRNALFVPTRKSRSPDDILIHVPNITLQDFDIDEFIFKRLVARKAFFERPDIRLQMGVRKSRKKKQDQEDSRGFYGSLSALSNTLRVNELIIKQGSLDYREVPKDRFGEARGINGFIQLSDFLRSDEASDIKASIPSFQIGDMQLRSRSTHVLLKNLNILGEANRNFIDSLEIIWRNSQSVVAYKVFWKYLDWDSLLEGKSILADSLVAHSIRIRNVIQKKDSAESGKTAEKASISLDYFRADFFEGDVRLPGNAELTLNARNVEISKLWNGQKTLHWDRILVEGDRLEFQSPRLNITSADFDVDTREASNFQNLKVEQLDKRNNWKLSVPLLELNMPVFSSGFDTLNIINLFARNPQLSKQYLAESAPEARKSGTKKALVVNWEDIWIQRGAIDWEDSSRTEKNLVHAKGVDMRWLNGKALLENGNVRLQSGRFSHGMDSLQFAGSTVSLTSQQLRASYSSLDLEKKSGEALRLTTEQMQMDWNQASLNASLKKGQALEIYKLTGGFRYPEWKLTGSVSRSDIARWISQFYSRSGDLIFRDSAYLYQVYGIGISPDKKQARFDSVQWNRLQAMDSYFAATPKQADYITVAGGPVTIDLPDLEALADDSSLRIPTVQLQHLAIHATRNKIPPFVGGVIKKMPGQMLQSIRHTFQVDSVHIIDSDIYYHEISDVTRRTATVPIRNVTGSITGLHNRAEPGDSLRIEARGRILHDIEVRMRHHESLSDSLSGFVLQVSADSFRAPILTKITSPMTAVAIPRGKIDSLRMHVTGNDYFSYGDMRLVYDKLTIRLQDKDDPSRRSLKLRLINFVANTFVVESKNRSVHRAYFERNREKFVINYWIKILLSGMMTNAGVKSNKSYDEQMIRKSRELGITPLQRPAGKKAQADQASSSSADDRLGKAN